MYIRTKVEENHQLNLCETSNRRKSCTLTAFRSGPRQDLTLFNNSQILTSLNCSRKINKKATTENVLIIGHRPLLLTVITLVTAKPISAFIFATKIIQFLYSLTRLTVFCGCMAWFVSDLDEYPEDRFPRGAVIFSFAFQWISSCKHVHEMYTPLHPTFI